jgi:antitoxin component YwqK of YwqJK toxin-antitoxin module
MEQRNFDREGRRHGAWQETWPSGRLRITCCYVNGVLDGEYKEHHDNESNLPAITGWFNKGKASYTWEQYELGSQKRVAKTSFSRGKPVNTWRYKQIVPLPKWLIGCKLV